MASTEVYNPAKNAWTTMASMPKALFRSNAIVVTSWDEETSILVLGGKTSGPTMGVWENLADVFEYRPSNDSWYSAI